MGKGKKMHGVIGGERRKRGERELGCGRFFQHGTHHPSLKMAFAKKSSLHDDGESEREKKSHNPSAGRTSCTGHTSIREMTPSWFLFFDSLPVSRDRGERC